MRCLENVPNPKNGGRKQTPAWGFWKFWEGVSPKNLYGAVCGEGEKEPNGKSEYLKEKK